MHLAMRQTGHQLPVFAFVIPIPGRILLFAGHQRAVTERQLEFPQARLGAGNLVKIAVLGLYRNFHLLDRPQQVSLAEVGFGDRAVLGQPLVLSFVALGGQLVEPGVVLDIF